MEQRKTRRFELRLPLAVTRTGPERVAHACRTRNISSTGVLFASDRALTSGPIEYTVTLGAGGEGPAVIRCVGKVVRQQQAPEEGAYHVAATLERYEFVRKDAGL